MNRKLAAELLAPVSRSFSLTIQALPRALREPIALAYLLARASDTIADTESASATARLESLAAFREMVRTGRGDVLPHPIVPDDPGERRLLEKLPECFDWLRTVGDADRGDIVEVLGHITRGQELDIRRFQPDGRGIETAAELDEYTYLVAGCVGEFWTRVCCRHVRSYARLEMPEMERLGRSFGQGLQLVNVLRDLPADLRAGRCYLPREEVGDRDRDPGRMQQAFTPWMQSAAEHLADGHRYIAAVRPWRLCYACFLPWRLGVLTLRLMRTHPPLQTGHRVKVSRSTVRKTMLLGLLAAANGRFLQTLAGGKD